jgi:hypothetical protein
MALIYRVYKVETKSAEQKTLPRYRGDGGWEVAGLIVSYSLAWYLSLAGGTLPACRMIVKSAFTR